MPATGYVAKRKPHDRSSATSNASLCLIMAYRSHSAILRPENWEKQDGGKVYPAKQGMCAVFVRGVVQFGAVVNTMLLWVP